MADKTNNNAFRLDDEHQEKLENLASSNGVTKSAMATNIIVQTLNDNFDSLMVNFMCYPRPFLKKVFSVMNKEQLQLVIADLNEYNKGTVKSSLEVFSKSKLMELFRGWCKRSGCEYNISIIDQRKILVIHHEMEKNWSTFTCAVVSYFLGLLSYTIDKTFVDKNWFKIIYHD